MLWLETSSLNWLDCTMGDLKWTDSVKVNLFFCYHTDYCVVLMCWWIGSDQTKLECVQEAIVSL